jgi:hypothetical protein
MAGFFIPVKKLSAEVNPDSRKPPHLVVSGQAPGVSGHAKE